MTAFILYIHDDAYVCCELLSSNLSHSVEALLSLIFECTEKKNVKIHRIKKSLFYDFIYVYDEDMYGEQENIKKRTNISSYIIVYVKKENPWMKPAMR